MTVVFSSETMETRRKPQNTFKGLKGKNSQPRILYAVKISFRNESEVKTFSGGGKVREFVASRSSLKEMLKAVLGRERK